jgi:hypothetical protein
VARVCTVMARNLSLALSGLTAAKQTGKLL